eukprot:CAMPEP_0195281676 /NCGR_PEP_ID=MMETSP0707-20130614/887_1 /TAXON_ID=33640 /ORGANISM="Asterionellopsis glacialis, Strain CCMP134" /LENGTH=357 /DNA_ID=CAMNT_0040340583 /DNA_START=81 /DNA_END=1154 /DNA_ORIENTATION=-
MKNNDGRSRRNRNLKYASFMLLFVGAAISFCNVCTNWEYLPSGQIVRRQLSRRNRDNKRGRKAIQQGKRANRPLPSKSSSIIAVINTPKCGTGGLTIGASKTLHCSLPQEPIPNVQHKDCEDGHVIRTHDVINGMQLLGDIRKSFKQQKQQKGHEGDQQQCLIITAVRDPQTWLPSLFLESNRNELCDRNEDKSASRQQHLSKKVMRMYKHWMNTNMYRVRWGLKDVRPQLLEEFGTNLRTEMGNIERNGGYSLIPHPSASSLYDGDNVLNGCELLFLRMEDHEKWPSILSSVLPGGFTYDKPSGRVDLCPNIKEAYKDLLEYKLPYRDRNAIIGDDSISPHILDYFNAYGYLSPNK